MRNTRDPRGRYARWLEESEEFEFVIKHRPGVTNSHADALSRMPGVNALMHDDLFSLEEFRKFQQTDPVLGVLINIMRGGGNQFLDTTLVMRRWLNKRRFLSLGKKDGLL